MSSEIKGHVGNAERLKLISTCDSSIIYEKIYADDESGFICKRLEWSSGACWGGCDVTGAWAHATTSTFQYTYTKTVQAHVGSQTPTGPADSSFRRFSGWNFAIIGRGLCVLLVNQAWFNYFPSLCAAGDEIAISGCARSFGWKNGIFFGRNAKYTLLKAQKEDYFLRLYGWHAITMRE